MRARTRTFVVAGILLGLAGYWLQETREGKPLPATVMRGTIWVTPYFDGGAEGQPIPFGVAIRADDPSTLVDLPARVHAAWRMAQLTREVHPDHKTTWRFQFLPDD